VYQAPRDRLHQPAKSIGRKRRHADIAEVTGAVPCWDIHAPAEARGQVCVIATKRDASLYASTRFGGAGLRKSMKCDDEQITYALHKLHPAGNPLKGATRSLKEMVSQYRLPTEN